MWNTNQCHKNLWSSLVRFWLCMVPSLVDRPVCLLLASASFLLLPPQSSQRSQLCFTELWSSLAWKPHCNILSHHRAVMSSPTHPLFPIGLMRVSLDRRSLWGRGSCQSFGIRLCSWHAVLRRAICTLFSIQKWIPSATVRLGPLPCFRRHCHKVAK